MKDFIWMSKKEAKCISDVLIAFAIYSYESFKTKQKLKALNSWINIQNQFEIKGIGKETLQFHYLINHHKSIVLMFVFSNILGTFNGNLFENFSRWWFDWET